MKRRDRIILSGLGCVILLGGFWMLVISPKMKQSKELTTEIAKMEEEIEVGKSEVKEVKHETVDFSKTYATLAKLGKAVPVAESVDDDVPSLLLQLNQGGKVTKTSFDSFEVGESAAAGGAASPTAAAAQTPTEQGAPAGAEEGASGASGAEGAPVAPPVTLNEVSYKYSYQGTLYELENLMNYLINLVNVEGQRMKISGRLIAIKKIEFTVVSPSNNPMLRTNVEVATYTTPKGEGIATGGGAVAGASGSASPDAVPGAPPQAQPATPPSATVKRP